MDYYKTIELKSSELSEYDSPPRNVFPVDKDNDDVMLFIFPSGHTVIAECIDSVYIRRPVLYDKEAIVGKFPFNYGKELVTQPPWCKQLWSIEANEELKKRYFDYVNSSEF